MEMIEGIYENNESYMNENRNKQQPPNSGVITAGSWWHKLALVCQGLLCVFLLIVIIVLGVYISLAAERNQLKMDNYNLTAERNQLKRNNYNLTVERDQLRKKNEFLKQFAVLEQGCTYFNSSVYSIITETKNWSVSRQDCVQRGADLVIINSKEEQVFISRCFPNTQIWIGLNDKDSERKWMWVDGTALNTGFWSDGQPNNAGGNQDCVFTGYTNTSLNSWNDFGCNISFVGICERKMFVP